MVVGNLYTYLAWQGKDYIDSGMRKTLFTVLGILAAVGCCLFLVLKRTDMVESAAKDKSKCLGYLTDIGASIVKCFKGNY